MKGLLSTRYEHDMLEQERALTRRNGNLDLFLKTSCMLLVSEGRFQKDVADLFKVPFRTLEWWLEQYRTSGMSALIKGPYPGKPSWLSTDQEKELAQIIEAGPEKAGFDTGVWTAGIVKSLITSRFGVSYGLCQVRRILRALCFSVQLPRRVPSEEDPEKQKEWIESDLPEIRKEVRSDGGALLYEDEASFQQSGTLTQPWCVKGKGCEVMSFPTRKSVKAFGADGCFLGSRENPAV
jgi:transposase